MSDPVADFLAREQDVLAGIDDALIPSNDTINPPPLVAEGAAAMAPPPPPPQPMDNGHDDFSDFEHLNGGGDSGVDLSALDGTNMMMAGSVPPPAAAAAAYRGNASATPSPLTIGSTPKIEPEKIRKWREEQKVLLQKKDEAEEKKRDEMRANAKKELEDWYAQRDEQLRKKKEANRKAEEEILADRDSTEDGAEWDRIAKLCEFNTKNSKNTTDVSRLRSILLQLKSRKQ